MSSQKILSRTTNWVERLMKVCGNRASAEAELRWIREHAIASRRPGRQLMTAEERLQRIIYQRTVQHKPLQYILQTQPFCGLEFRVRRPVLIPRPETEQWLAYWLARFRHFAVQGADKTHSSGRINSESLNEASKNGFRLLDMGCGTGCIAISALHHGSRWNRQLHVDGMDINPHAVQLAGLNARKLITDDGMRQRLTLFTADMLAIPSDSKQKYDAILSNPPYISHQEYETQLERNVRDWEDRRALVGTRSVNADGLEYYRHIIDFARSHLTNNSCFDASKNDDTSWEVQYKDLPFSGDIFDPDANDTDTDDTEDSEPLPSLMLEIGDTQAEQLIRMLERYPGEFHHLTVWRDCFGRDRCVSAAFRAR